MPKLAALNCVFSSPPSLPVKGCTSHLSLSCLHQEGRREGENSPGTEGDVEREMPPTPKEKEEREVEEDLSSLSLLPLLRMPLLSSSAGIVADSALKVESLDRIREGGDRGAVGNR